ncbi:adenylate cyclase [Novosphingobium marinum]|uniref:CYTH domain-containing protein n=1 Tax=Novosphingobium marinum TaxID=1514948 RepID=A0A7Z0BVH1_9SPHN|nr:CYTH domain-containing protein [Novosphingobium marinum]NYH96258.1 CYTH domain-containing protein [Novosphingobium marinum]GGC33732.1 adenylate cyclase [Novosphingobium marinum]
MASEIERKFLVTGDGWRDKATDCLHIVQCYLAQREDVEVRIRVTDGQKARLTVKSGNAEKVRSEFEYSIPVPDAREMMRFREGRMIEKRRYIVPREDGRHWEVDVFEGDLEGLILAEVEFEDGDGSGEIDLPGWLGEEVTGDGRYYNSVLARTG